MRWLIASLIVGVVLSAAYVVVADRRDLRQRIVELEKRHGAKDAASDARSEGSPAVPNMKDVDARLQVVFAGQAGGSAWAKTARSQVLAAFAKAEIPKGALESLECRGVWCHARFDRPDENQARDIAERVRHLEWMGPMTAFMLDDEREGTAVKVFLAQPGTPLPQL